ncbi:DNA-3-methyladenine glycosylase family protein [Cohnella panacarvi]|uniref:DNA-3-methyladenine glycosylase family protein n=1 Tax=Cohnella panacarvi TaxID=400776 RepID=UPI00047D2C29|nr:DNA-3-methyladenine glycosylase [Cohnella panacarvi]
MSNQAVHIDVPTTFDYGVNIAYLSRSPNECMHAIAGNAVYKRIPTGLSNPLIEVTGKGNEPLQVRSCHPNAPLADEEVHAIRRYVREMFDLDTDLTPFYEMAQEDATLTDVVKSFHGLRILGIPDLFEALCWGILGQQINLAFAYTLKRRFVEKYGGSVVHNGVRHWTFPDPSVIAQISPQDLTTLQITGRKSEYLIGVARLIAEGTLSKDKLLTARDVKQAERLLTGIRGIGPWTANYVLMRCLKYPTAFPIDDVGLHNAIKAVHGMPDKPTIAYIRQLSAGWAGWEAYATFYLWRVLY